jgi:integrase
MARAINRLSVRKIETLMKPGRYADGGGLYLEVSSAGAKSWVYMWKRQGKRREMGLGGLRVISLSQARQLADDARRVVAGGRDPLEERDRENAGKRAIPTFGEMATRLVDGIESGFRNEKHRRQWRATLGITPVDPKRVIGDPVANRAHERALRSLREKLVSDITTDDVLGVLAPIWTTKSETASRIRGRIERVLDAAKAQGLRTEENPARLKGHLDTLLPKRQRLARGHHGALAFEELPAFMLELREADGIGARALEFTILTAARSGETLGMRWDEIDLDAETWTVPAERMKAGRSHRVPLSADAVAVLKPMAEVRVGEFVFPGARLDRPLSGMAMAMQLRRLGRGDVTVHGFRSTFRDWAGEKTHFPREVAEAALAHVVGDATERAYRRGDAMEKRRELMDAWARWCRPPGEVVALVRKAPLRR